MRHPASMSWRKRNEGFVAAVKHAIILMTARPWQSISPVSYREGSQVNKPQLGQEYV